MEQDRNVYHINQHAAAMMTIVKGKILSKKFSVHTGHSKSRNNFLLGEKGGWQSSFLYEGREKKGSKKGKRNLI